MGVAGANALGQMGANGADNVNLGGSGDGFNMAAMMASMAVGGAVGQNIAGAMNNVMGGINQQTMPGAVPPPHSYCDISCSGQWTSHRPV